MLLFTEAVQTAAVLKAEKLWFMCWNSCCKNISEEKFWGVLLTCRPSDIILSNSFQNVTAGAPIKKTRSNCSQSFQPATNTVKKGKSNFYLWAAINKVDKSNLLSHHFSPTCHHIPLPARLHGNAQLLSTQPAALWEVNLYEYSQMYFSGFLTLSGLAWCFWVMYSPWGYCGQGQCALESSLILVDTETGQNLSLLHALRKQPANPLAGLSEKKPSEASDKSWTHRLSETGYKKPRGWKNTQ